MHITDPEVWESYVGGVLPELEQRRIAQHLQTCTACQRHFHQLEYLERAWYQVGTRLQQRYLPDEARLRGGLKRLLVRVVARQQAEELSSERLQARLKELEQALSTFFGSRVATTAIRLSAEASTIGGVASLNAGNWEDFIENLSRISQIVGGISGSALVRAIGLART